MTNPAHENEFDEIESTLRRLKPTTDIETQLRLAYAAGANSNSKSQPSAKQLARFWQVVSFALAGCLLFLIASLNWTSNLDSQNGLGKPMAQNDPIPLLDSNSEDRHSLRSPGLRAADWRVFQIDDQPATDNVRSDEAIRAGTPLRTTSTSRLVDSI